MVSFLSLSAAYSHHIYLQWMVEPKEMLATKHHTITLGNENKEITVVLGSIVVSISACHAEDPGSIPGRGVFFPENL